MTTRKRASKPGVNTPTKQRAVAIPTLAPVPKASLPAVITAEKQQAPPPANPHHVELMNDGRPVAEQKADSILSPITTNALVSMNALWQTIPKEEREAIGIGAFDRALRSKVDAVVAGDMKEIEAVAASQVFSLNALFVQLATRAQLNMGEHPQAAETYLRLAFKAQSQCRASVETLGELKNPTPLFAKNFNLANGNQQVNNAEGPQQINNAPRPLARAEEPVPANKLLETV